MFSMGCGSPPRARPCAQRDASASAAGPPCFPLTGLGRRATERRTPPWGKPFATATAFAEWLIGGRGKNAFWTKRTRGLAAAAYQAAQLEGEEGEACKARALDILRAPEAVLLERLGRSIAVSVSMQVELLSRLSPNQRASILEALKAAADKYARPAGGHRGAKVALSDRRLAGGVQARVVGPDPPVSNHDKRITARRSREG